MLNNTSVKMRLTTLSIIPLVVFLIAVAISISIMNSLIKGIDSLYEDRVVPLKQIKEVSDNYAVNIVDLLHKYRAGLLTSTQTVEQINQAKSSADDYWDAYLSTTLTDKEQQLVQTSSQRLEPVRSLISKYVNMIESKQLVAIPAELFNETLYSTFDPLSVSLKALIDLQLSVAGVFKQTANENFDTTKSMLILVATILTLLMAIVAWQVYRSIQQSVDSLKTTITRIAESADLTLRAPVNGKDEIAQTAIGFNRMVERLNTLVKGVGDATNSLAASSEEMSVISTQVSETAIEQEQQTAMIATAVTEMSMAIQEVAQNANHSSEKANEANKAALLGQNKIQENINAINNLARIVDSNTARISELNQQTNEINQVVLMIQSIAEQTNLLALNAAIEAARAGESGRGFAVVADEVRQLAHNTQQSTTNINDMITKLQHSAQEAVRSMEGAQSNANESVTHAEESSKVLIEIVEAVNEIVDMNIQVSAATEEQTTVADEISQNINEFSTSIILVAENASHSADASSEVAKLADSLQQQVSIFKTK